MRILELLRVNPSSFSDSSITEDPKYFMKEFKKMFDVIHVVCIERVEFSACQLKSVART